MASDVNAVLDEEIARRIKAECMTGDWECDHGRADDILIQALRTLGLNETAVAYEEVGKWYA